MSSFDDNFQRAVVATKPKRFSGRRFLAFGKAMERGELIRLADLPKNEAFVDGTGWAYQKWEQTKPGIFNVQREDGRLEQGEADMKVWPMNKKLRPNRLPIDPSFEHLIRKIDEREKSRRWKTLPSDFQRDAVRGLAAELKPHGKGMKATSKLGRTTTFSELRAVVWEIAQEHAQRVGKAKS